jgi:hypothetical protein
VAEELLASQEGLCPVELGMYSRTNREFCPVQHSVNGFHNIAEKCLLRGTNCVF